MAEWSNAPDSKLGAVLKAFSALHQCMPANERFLSDNPTPACSKIAGKKLCSLSLIGVAMRMPQNRVDCDAGSQHCYAEESSEFSLESRTTTCFLGFVFPGNPHSDPPHPSLQAVFDPLPSFYLTPQWLQCRAPAVQARFVNGRVRPLVAGRPSPPKFPVSGHSNQRSA